MARTRDEIRQEAMRRVQIGIAGLIGVLLLVGLTNVIIDNVRKDGALEAVQAGQSTPNAGMAQEGQSSEPLADLGVTPSSEGHSVPDLEPDPHLQKPMDRDPRPHQ